MQSSEETLRLIKKWVPSEKVNEIVANLVRLGKMKWPESLAKPDNLMENKIESKVVNTKITAKVTARETQDHGCACPIIPFSLGNGLPVGAPGAVANSDGTYGTFIISSPGNYVLQNSPQMEITGSSIYNPNVAISIVSSNVNLDLCGQVLTGSGNLTAPLSPVPTVPGGIKNDTRVDATVGITITGTSNAPLENVKITNGTLQYHELSAIQVTYVNNITLLDLNIQHCGFISETNFFGPMVVNFMYNNMIYMENVHFAYNRYGDVLCNPYSNDIPPTMDFTIKNCSSTGLRGTNTIFFDQNWLLNQDYVDYGIAAWSFQIDSVQNLTVDNLKITDVQAFSWLFGLFSGSFVIGNNFTNVNVSGIHAVLKDETTITTTTPLSPVHEIRGIALETGSKSCVLENCNVSDVTSVLETALISVFTPVNTLAGYNVERMPSKVVRNCTASDIFTAGKVKVLNPSPNDTMIVNWPAAGFYSEEQTYLTGFPNGRYAQNAVFDNCVASNINAFSNVNNPNGPSEGYGFVIDTVGFFDDYPNNTPKTLAHVFKNCVAQDCTGSEVSAGFGIKQRNYLYAPSSRPMTPVMYENCISQHDRVFNPASLSNGFYTDTSASNVVYKGCVAQGHSLNGFELSGNQTIFSRSPGVVGLGQFVLEDCIANGNSNIGFHFNQDLQNVEVINCKSTNNNQGYVVDGKTLVFRSCVADMNTADGFVVNAYFPFIADVATDTPLESLPIYGGAYTLQYVPGFDQQYILLVPTSPQASLPPLTINGVLVNQGTIVLVKNEIGANAVLNGVYEVLTDAGVSVSGTLTPVYKLVRVDQWRAPQTVVACTKILVKNSSSPNLTPHPVVYILQNTITVDVNAPVFKSTKKLMADKSQVVVDNGKAALNGSDGFYNTGRDVVFRSSVADLNGKYGFEDNSFCGAEKNGNLYTENKTFDNKKCNFKVDYVIPENKTVLQVGSLHPPQFPKVSGVANISITRRKL